MKKDIPCPVSMKEYERINNNLKIYEKLNNEQKDWLEYYMDKHNHELKNVVLTLDKNNILCIITNTSNSVKQFVD